MSLFGGENIDENCCLEDHCKHRGISMDCTDLLDSTEGCGCPPMPKPDRLPSLSLSGDRT